jgi:hypothetical protein
MLANETALNCIERSLDSVKKDTLCSSAMRNHLGLTHVINSVIKEPKSQVFCLEDCVS